MTVTHKPTRCNKKENWMNPKLIGMCNETCLFDCVWSIFSNLNKSHLGQGKILKGKTKQFLYEDFKPLLSLFNPVPLSWHPFGFCCIQNFQLVLQSIPYKYIVYICVSNSTRLENYLLFRAVLGHEGPDCQQAAVSDGTQFNLKPGGRRQQREKQKENVQYMYGFQE